jgi:ribonucleoside-diphosphate reductase alpha chain
LPLSVVITDLLYSYKMGVKTLYYANSDDGKTDTESEDNSCASGACKL